MKELVTAFAACAIAGAVMAADSNIVGYVSTVGNDNGATLLAPMFIECGGVNAKLGMITGEFDEYLDTVQILDDTLAMAVEYVWVDVTYDPLGLTSPVWSSDYTTDDSDVVIPRGVGVVVSKSTAIIQYAGEVEAGGVSIACDPGATVLGNPTPVTITLGQIGFTDLEEYTDTIQLLDSTLAMATEYVWVDVTYDPLGLTPPVWSSDYTADDSGVELAPGVGFVLSSMNGSTVTFPAAL